jgi:hypothetical protein
MGPGVFPNLGYRMHCCGLFTDPMSGALAILLGNLGYSLVTSSVRNFGN